MVDALSHWWLITSIINTRNANEVIETRLINFKYLWRLFQSISYYSFKYWSRDLLIIWMNVHRKHNLKSDDSCAKWKVLSVTVSVPASYPAPTRHWSKYREEQGCLLLSSVEHVALWAEATRVWSTVRLLSVRAHLLPWRGRCGVCEPCVHLSLLLYAALPPADPLTGLTQKWHLRLTEFYHLHLQSIQFSSVTQSCPTLCDPMDCSAPGFPFHHQLLELAQTHVHRVCDAIQSSHSLSSTSPPAFSLSQHQGLFKWVSSSHQWPKYWNFSFSISPSNEYLGLISFRIDWFDLLTVQGTLKSLLQHHNSKASILWGSAFFIVQLSHPYMTTGKP